jgi:hypothetical protein
VNVAGKIGYGTVSETLASKTPLVFVRRDHFNEEPFFRKMLEVPRLCMTIFKKNGLEYSIQRTRMKAMP